MFATSQNRCAHVLRFLIILAVCASGSAAFAQVTSGTIFGSVTDVSGAVVPSASVTVRSAGIGVTRTATTSASGEFVVPNLPPATYSITVDAKGFKRLEAQNVVLSAADKLNAGDLVLQVGATTESVSVTADAAQLQLQSNSGERSDLITSKQLDDVAMNGRNVLDYMKLLPGVIGTADFHQSGTGGIDAFNINGTRANQHEFTIDGASNVDTGNNGGTHVTLNTDSIEEAKILTSNYQAEFGKAAGGQVALVTKSGTNQWHGNARFFHRHEGFNANEWFNKKNELNSATPHNSPPLYRYNDIGYQIGGPLKKDRLFVFWSQEFYRQLVPVGTFQFYTPTALERKGDFSQSTDDSGNPVSISGPGITNNVITSGINPAMQALLNLFPLPNVNGFGVNGQNYNFSENLSGHAPRREDILRVDYQVTQKNRLFGRWLYNSEDDVFPFTGNSGPFGVIACVSIVQFPGGCTQHHPGWNASLNLVSTITPTLLNEASIGPSHTLTRVDGANGNISLAKNNITLPLLYPTTTIPDISFGGLGNVAFSGPYLGGTPWYQGNTTVNVNDNLTWIKQNHTIKTGLFYQRAGKNQIAWNNINGQFSFQPTTTNGYNLGDPIAAELLGYFNSFSQSTARPIGNFRYNQLEFYVQDTWKVNTRLTLDYGMRFAWIPPQYDAKNQIALFDPAAYVPANAVQIDSGGNILAGTGDPLNGMKYVKNGQIPDGGWNSRGIMPEPRFGFAYDLFSNHKTVIRGGVGMMHDRVQGNLIFNTVFNNPAVVKTAEVSANNVVNLPSLGGTFANFVQGDKNIIGAARDGKVPTIYSFSLGLQHEIAKGTTLDIAYVGTMSRHLVTSRDINAVPYGFAFTAAAQDPGNFSGGVVPAVEPNLPPAYAAAGFNFSGAYAFGHQSYTNAALVPYKGYGQIAYLKWDGTSNYNSLQASLQRRFSRGLTFGAVYTYSKVLGTADSDGDWQDPFNVRALDYRELGFDRTHVFAANYVYDIPGPAKHLGGPKWLSYITDNFQLSGVTQFLSGSPVRLGSWSGEPGALDGGNMWGIIPYFYTLDSTGNFVIPPIGTRIRGTQLRTGGMQNWDMSLLKNVPLGNNERYSLQLRLEAYNVFNHPNFNDKFYPTTGNNGAGLNFDGPFEWTYGTPAGAGSSSPTFSLTKAANWGQNADTYNSSGGPGGFRVLQLGAKFIF